MHTPEGCKNPMHTIWFVITLVFSTLLQLIDIGRLSNQEKDLEIMILRHQLDILERKQK